MKSKTLPLAISVFSLCLLQACGGGDGDSAPSGGSHPPRATLPPGPIRKFAATESPDYFLNGRYILAEGLNGFEQDADGAMTTLESISLSGQYELKDVSGDADFAMGRWVKGTVTLTDTSYGKPVITTLTGQDAGSFHYLVFNKAKNLPQTGAYACDAGTFTTPTYEGGGSGAHSDSGTATGSASLSFEVGGPRMGGEIVVSADGASGSAPLKRVVPGQMTFATHTFTGDFFNNSAGNGAAVFLGHASTGGFFVMASYAAVLSNGARYIGVARFSCK